MREELLLDDEVICWEGRPAPRCYTFRHWRHSIFGVLVLLICSWWQVLGFQMADEYTMVWLNWLPTPFLLYALYLTFGHLFQARLEWNQVYYVITNRRLLAQRGILKRRVESFNLSEITYFSLHQQGEQLGTLHVYKGEENRLILHCLEYPRQATDLLERAMGKKRSPNGDCDTLDSNSDETNEKAD